VQTEQLLGVGRGAFVMANGAVTVSVPPLGRVPPGEQIVAPTALPTPRITGQSQPTARCSDGSFDYSGSINACAADGGVAYWVPNLPEECVQGSTCPVSATPTPAPRPPASPTPLASPTPSPIPTPAGTPAANACSSSDATQAFTLLQSPLQEFRDELPLAAATPRNNVTLIVQNIQATGRKVENLQVPACASQAQSLLKQAIDLYATELLNFSANGNGPTVAQDDRNFQAVFSAALRELSALATKAGTPSSVSTGIPASVPGSAVATPTPGPG
jgi:hypothetical protein